jgi:hypothetical protein
MMKNPIINKYVRYRLYLAGFLFVVVAVAIFFDVLWLASFYGVVAGYFVFVTLFQFKDKCRITSKECTKYIKQSQSAMRSDIYLTGLLLLLAIVALLFGALWLAKIGGALAGLCAAIALAEHWNVLRLKGMLSVLSGPT